jgi:hypothetical protein
MGRLRLPQYGFKQEQTTPQISMQQVAGCSGKAGFETFPLAQKILGKPRGKTLGKASPYKCRFCRMWHIGTSIWKE